MKEKHEISYDSQLYYRLIGLWVLCEGLIGGIIHGLKIPISGLVVGSGAVICICFIAHYVPVKGAIIKATIIVAIFKMMLSPHSPPAAYLAVLFQGCLGQLLFLNLKYFKLSCVILGLLSMIESAVQRVLVLMILYGTKFWNAVDQFIMKITNQSEQTNYSLIIAITYIAIHAAIGLLVGLFAASLVRKSNNWDDDHSYFINVSTSDQVLTETQGSKIKMLRTSFIITWFFLIFLFIQSYWGPGDPLLPPIVPVQILLRSLLILLTWYLLLSPLLMKLLQKWLVKRKSKMQHEIQEVLVLLPTTKSLVYKSWQVANGKTRLIKVRNFLKIVLLNSLRPNA